MIKFIVKVKLALKWRIESFQGWMRKALWMRKCKKLSPNYKNIFITINKVKEEKLTYLSTKALYQLVESVIFIEHKGLKGAFIETGCGLGGSSIAITSAKSSQRVFFIYDIFGIIPPPSEKDGVAVEERYELIKSGEVEGIDGKLYYGYQKDLYRQVVQKFSDFQIDIEKNHVSLVKGLYQDTLKVDFPVALAHIDCDYYEAVLLSLQQIEPQLVSQGSLIIDDYYDWPGCQRAVDEYFRERNDFHFLRKERLQIVKK